MRTIKWGIIGAGRISSKFATALNSLDHTELIAVASRDLEKSKEFTNRFHVKKAYGSYEEMVKDPEIDVIYIGTPHTEHKANAALCISNGKAVLCEKPFALNQKETQYLIALAKEYNVFLMEAMWTKLLPTTQRVKKWIQDKVIGDVKYFNISFGYYSEFDLNNRAFNPLVAGGALLDVGVYPIAYVTHMMGKLPDQVDSSAYIGKSNVDEMNVIAFRYNEGVMANLSSAICVNTSNTAVIMGEMGKIVVENFWRAERAQVYDANGNMVDTFSQPFITNGYEFEAEEVNRCIREAKTESEIIPLQDTLDIIKIMDEIRAKWGLTYPQEQSEL